MNISELNSRAHKFFKLMNKLHSDWDIAIIIDKVNQYYFTGTMQNGVLIFLKSGDMHFFVKKSYSRAKMESPIENIRKINSYRDIVDVIGSSFKNGFIELETVPVNMLNRINKHLKVDNIKGLDSVISYQQSVKSAYEIEIMKRCGSIHGKIFQEKIPNILKEGMTEQEFYIKCFNEMMLAGHMGLSRNNMFQATMLGAQIGFGENSVYPTDFDGPGGAKGLSPVVPFQGDSSRKLKKGDLIYVDIGFAMEGYNTDKTQVYILGESPTEEIANLHNKCIEIKDTTASMFKPGAIPSAIYSDVMNSLSDEFKQNFMGLGEDAVKFLGHGTGLIITGAPVIANRFDNPLEENMVIALEPKKAIEEVGTVGVEDTYIVTPSGGECITGDSREIIIVK